MEERSQFLKVLFVSHGSVIKDGGYKTRVLSEIEAVAGGRANHRIIKPVLLSFEPRQEYAKEKESHVIENMLNSWGIKSYFFNRGFFDQNFLLRAIFWIWESVLVAIIALKEKVGTVHVEAHYAALRCLLASRLLQIPLVFDVHGLHVEERHYAAKVSYTVEDKILKSLERSYLRYSSCVLTVSEAMKDYFEKTARMKKVSIVPCCVNTELFRYDEKSRLEMREILGFTYDFVVLYSGSFFTEWQQPEIMINVFKEIKSRIHKSLFFVLTSEKEEDVKGYLVAHGLEKNSFKIKGLNHREVPRYLIVGDVGLLIREKSIVNQVASPTKFAEYLACGVPVLCTDGIGDISNIVREYKVGWILNNPIQNENWDLVCQNLLKISNDETRMKCLQIAHQYFNWKNYGDKLADIYSGLSFPKKGILQN